MIPISASVNRNENENKIPAWVYWLAALLLMSSRVQPLIDSYAPAAYALALRLFTRLPAKLGLCPQTPLLF